MWSSCVSLEREQKARNCVGPRAFKRESYHFADTIDQLLAATVTVHEVIEKLLIHKLPLGSTYIFWIVIHVQKSPESFDSGFDVK